MDLSLYIHIPFCKSKCFYCSFASYPDCDERIDEYLDVLDREAAVYERPACSTVYIGGGTPTHLSLKQAERLIRIVRDRFIVAKDAEFTIEANPATFDLHKAKALRHWGINRVSLGIQSLREENLRWLGRPHSCNEAFNSYLVLRQAGFKNVNLDFIYALPHETEDQLKDDLKEVEALRGEHLSLYALSIEKGSVLAARKIQPLGCDRQAEYYKTVVRFLKACGYSQYEVSNFSKAGYSCQHNINYWRAGDYIGLGAAAHSHIAGTRYWNTEDIASYILLMQEKGLARSGQERLIAEERLREAFLIGLRLSEGVWLKGLEDRFGVVFPEHKMMSVRQYVQEGLLEEFGGVIRVTSAGMLVLDSLCASLY